MSEAPENRESKPSFANTISSFSPWGSRNTNPRFGEQPPANNEKDEGKSGPAVQRGGDHTVSHRYRISNRSYPKDCPTLQVQWYHAVDVAKRKPNYVQPPGLSTHAGDNASAPKKWNPFSVGDSREIEFAFQEVADKEENEHGHGDSDGAGDTGMTGTSGLHINRSTDASEAKAASGKPTVKVPVNEDYLFDVDIQRRELGPAYWLGPIYEVRRGTWFWTDGTPCDENLATQLEEGYLKTRPWRYGAPQRSASQPRRDSSVGDQSSLRGKASDGQLGLRSKQDGSAAEAAQDKVPAPSAPLTHRLFGAHMNSLVTYQDETTAWLVTDDFLSRMSGSMYQRFAGGAHLAGTKIVRGYVDPKKKTGRDGKDAGKPPSKDGLVSSRSSSVKDPDRRRSAPPGAAGSVRPGTPPKPEVAEEKAVEQDERHPESRLRRTLERQMSNLTTPQMLAGDEASQDEEARKMEEKEIADDYKDVPGDPQDREIEHLILVTHGIGQRLGARFETFNFIHDVNTLRKALKDKYNASPDLQALNAEVEKLPKNCRVQVLPICWRHLLDFPQQGIKANRKEHDIADIGVGDEESEYPSLDSITVEGPLGFFRHAVADLALDILLYQTPAYKSHISRIVVRESNRIFKLFKQRNPSFTGKVSLLGHSLGSAIVFDILCDLPKDRPAFEGARPPRTVRPADKDMTLDFDVEGFFCIGSPIGLFQMLKGRTVAGRTNPNKVTLDGGPDNIDEPFLDTPLSMRSSELTDAQRDALVSSPKCRSLFNIFHPADPVCYRLEPLISPDMASMKAQPLPYTKRSFFGASSGQSIVDIPGKLGQSVSGFWSNFSSGLANTFITRSMGLSAEDAAKLNSSSPARQPYSQQQQEDIRQQINAPRMSSGAGTNISAGGVLSLNAAAPVGDEEQRKRKHALSITEAGPAQRPPTLIDADMETLYSGFQKRRRSRQDDDAGRRGDANEDFSAWAEIEDRARKLRREDAKVRALNPNGRVDYSIQEGKADIQLIYAVTSHLGYWQDEDVAHFIISQLLARQRVVRKTKSTGNLGS